MIPGFVTNYIDKNNYKHLYFFQGIDDNNKSIYNNIDLDLINVKYEYSKNIDGSIDYKFYDRSIIKIICKLIDRSNKETLIILKYK